MEIYELLAKEHLQRRQGVELARSEVKVNLAKYKEAIERITSENV